MKVNVMEAEMHKEEDGTFLGKTMFTVEGHPEPYEITFFSKKGKDWDYSLHFAKESGSEERLLQVDAFLEESNEAFDQLLDSAIEAMPEQS